METAPDDLGTGPKIEVLVGPEILAAVPEAYLLAAADKFGEEVYDEPNVAVEEFRAQIEQVVPESVKLGIPQQRKGESVSPVPRGLTAFRREHMETVGENRARQRTRLMNNISSGATIALTVNGELAAIGSVKKYRKQMRDGREVFQMGQMFTVEKFRGQGLFKKIWDLSFQKLRTEHPEAVIIAHSRKPAVQAAFAKRGFTSTTSRGEYALLSGDDLSEEEIGKIEADNQRLGYKFMYFDPKEHGGH